MQPAAGRVHPDAARRIARPRGAPADLLAARRPERDRHVGLRGRSQARALAGRPMASRVLCLSRAATRWRGGGADGRGSGGRSPRCSTRGHSRCSRCLRCSQRDCPCCSHGGAALEHAWRIAIAHLDRHIGLATPHVPPRRMRATAMYTSLQVEDSPECWLIGAPPMRRTGSHELSCRYVRRPPP